MSEIFLDNCIFEFDPIPTDHFYKLKELGMDLDKYEALHISEAHVKRNPKLAYKLGYTALHRDFGVNQGILNYKVVTDFLDTISKDVKIGTVSFLHFPPGKQIDKHCDPVIRETILLIPISPLHDYSPCLFHDEEGNTHFIETNMPHIINSQIKHSMVNHSSFDRINFQLGIKHSFHHIKQLYEDGKFFV